MCHLHWTLKPVSHVLVMLKTATYISTWTVSSQMSMLGTRKQWQIKQKGKYSRYVWLEKPSSVLRQSSNCICLAWEWNEYVFSSVGKESACNAGDPGSLPGWGGSPGDGNGNPVQYSCLENPMDRRAWRATVHGSQESDTTEQLNHHHDHHSSHEQLLSKA